MWEVDTRGPVKQLIYTTRLIRATSLPARWQGKCCTCVDACVHVRAIEREIMGGSARQGARARASKKGGGTVGVLEGGRQGGRVSTKYSYRRVMHETQDVLGHNLGAKHVAVTPEKIVRVVELRCMLITPAPHMDYSPLLPK